MYKMNIENLKKSCRICLQEAEINVLVHRVKFPPASRSTSMTSSIVDNSDTEGIASEADDSSNKSNSEENVEQVEGDTEEISVQTILQIFGKWECKEMQLVCESCLHDLLEYYMYYRKILAANKRIKRLYNKALQMTSDAVDFETDVLHVLENDEGDAEGTIKIELQRHFVESVEKISTKNDNASYKIVSTSPGSLVVNQANASEDRCTASPVPRQQTTYKNKPTRHPKFILTGGVSQILTHANKNCLPDISAAAKRSICSVTQPQKRQRTLNECKSASNNTPLENGLLFVTKFIPSTNAIHCEVRNVEEQGKEITETFVTNELRTMDFKAVKISGHNLQDMVEEDDLTARLAASCDATEATVAPVYACKYCPQAYAMAEYLITHVRKSHVCTFCTQAFVKTTNLHEHIRQMHQQHKCAICSKVLSTPSNLRGHIKRMHGLKLPAQVALLDFKPTVEELPEIDRDDLEIVSQSESTEDGSAEYVVCIEEVQD